MNNIEWEILERIERKLDYILSPPVMVCGCGKALKSPVFDKDFKHVTYYCECGMETRWGL